MPLYKNIGTLASVEGVIETIPSTGYYTFTATTNANSWSAKFEIGTKLPGTMTVDWGDGNILSYNCATDEVKTIFKSVGKGKKTFKFNSSTGYIKASFVQAPGLAAPASLSVDNWSSQKFYNMDNQFVAINTVTSFNGKPDTSECTSMYRTFAIPYFNIYVNDWDLSNVSNMSAAFSTAQTFNQPLNNWNVSNVENMDGMFASAWKFNQPLNNWNVSNVENMNGMFSGAQSFNQSLNNWNVSNVSQMRGMFQSSHQFNQSLNNWNVSNVTNTSYMFADSRKFNQSLNNWDVSNVTNMGSMFASSGESSFNQPLNNWNVSNVGNMAYMFSWTQQFNQSLNNWNTANVANMDGMFLSATNFDQNISSWNVTNVGANHINFDTATKSTWTSAEKPQWVA